MRTNPKMSQKDSMKIVGAHLALKLFCAKMSNLKFFAEKGSFVAQIKSSLRPKLRKDLQFVDHTPNPTTIADL